MKISSTVGYAIAALLQLADRPSDAPLSTAAMSSVADMPNRYLMQVMKALKDAGLVVATRGILGGYTLAKPLNQISLQDVLNAIDGPASTDLKINGLNARSQRLIENTLSDIADDERRYLSAFTLDAMKLNWLQ